MLEAIKSKLADFITQFVCETVEANIEDIVNDFVDGLVKRLALDNMLLPQEDESRVIYAEPEYDEEYLQVA